MKLLLDTNVLIDLVAAREPYASSIRALCAAVTFGDVQAWVTTQSYMDAYYVLRRAASEERVKQALLATLAFFLPCGTNAADLKPALDSSWPDIEDCLITLTAKRIKADHLITRDEGMIARSSVPAMSAATLLERLKAEHGLTYDSIDL